MTMLSRAMIVAVVLAAGAQAQAQGTFTHQIQLKLPKGAAGVQPELAITYDSGAGNGILGVGWALRGLSRITRVNYGDGINYAPWDTYSHSLYGVLVAQSDGTYRSQTETFIRFQPVGTCGQGPCSWVLTDRTGTQYFYGSGPSSYTRPAPYSRLTGLNSSFRMWGLDKVQDLSGNYYEVSYLDANQANELYPAEITYTRNVNGSIPKFRHVRFQYSDRAQPEFSYAQGVPAWTSKLLDSITIHSDDPGSNSEVLLRTYFVVRDTSDATGRARVARIQERGRDQGYAGNQLTDQVFTYVGPSAGAGSAYQAQPAITATGIDNWGAPENTTIGDFDGDGFLDIVTVRSGVAKVKRPHSTATVEAGDWASGSWGPYVLAGDVNGDMKTDLISPSGTTIHVYRSTGTGFVHTTPTVGIAGSDSGEQAAMGDVNGDGRSDLIQLKPSSYLEFGPGSVYVSVWNGTGFTQKNWGTYGDWANTSITKMVTGDFNGDGRSDVAVLGATVPCDTAYGNETCAVGLPIGGNGLARMYLGQSNGEAATSTWDMKYANGSMASIPYTPTHLSFSWAADFNGDGKTDIGWRSSNGISVCYSHGKGFDCQNFTGGLTSWGGWMPQIADFNGDGMADIVSLDGSTVHAYLSKAQGFTKRDLSRDSSWTFGTQERTWIADFSGDGSPDILSARGATLDLFKFRSGIPPDLMTRLQNGSGGGVDVIYRGAGELGAFTALGPTETGPTDGSPWAVPYASNDPLVYEVMAWDGPFHIFTTRYTYAGRMFRNGTVPERRDLGYAWVSTLDVGSGARSDIYFNQTVPFEGKARLTQTMVPRPSDGQYVVKEAAESFYAEIDHDSESDNGVGQGTIFTMLQREVLHSYEYGTESFTQTNESTFSPYGNIGTRQQSATGLPTLRTVNTFSPIDTSRWILGRLNSTVTYRSEGTSWIQISRADNQWTGDQVTRKDQWLDTTNSMVSAWLTYDQVGNLVTTSEPHPVSSGPGPVTTTEYDASFRAYPVRVVNALGQSTRQVFDAEGKVVCAADRNNVKSKTAYDALGRKVSAWVEADGDTIGCSPAHLGTTLSQSDYGYDHQGELTPSLSVSARQSNSVTTWLANGVTRTRTEFYDGAQFVYLTRETLASGGYVCTAHEKDAAGRAYRNSLPYFCDSEGNSTQGTVAYSTTSWDTAGRVASVATPDGLPPTTYAYGTDEYGTAWESVTDPRGSATRRIYDARRRVIRVLDPLQQASNFGYDALGHTVYAQLPNGQVTTIAYDSLGRRTSIDAPQVGGANTASEHDALGRVTRSYEWQTGSTLASYTYDEAAYANGQGQLTTKQDLSGRTNVSYNSLGKPATVVKVVDGKTYTHQFAYDMAGRLTSLLYPDGSVVQYGYTDANLTTVTLLYNNQASWQDCRATPTPSTCTRTVLATYSDFTAAGRARKVQYGNGVTTNYTYDVMGRLLSLKTTDQSGATAQDLSYDWASMSGLTIKAITDNRPDKSFRDPATGAVTASTDETQVYDYDANYRLTGATGVWGQKSYAYDGIGNVTSFGGSVARSLNYDGQQVTDGTGLADVRYDSAGSMVHKVLDGAVWDYDWSASVQLQSVRKDGVLVADMVYDDDGQRSAKIFYPGGDPTKAITTYYLGKTYERRVFADNAGREEQTLNVLANDQLLISITRVGQQALAFNEANGWRTELAAASLYDGGTIKGTALKGAALLRALAAHPRTAPTALTSLFLAFAALVAFGLYRTLRRPRRELRGFGLSPALRVASAAVVLIFTLSSCGQDDSGRSLLARGGAGKVLDGDTSYGVRAGTRYYHRTQVNSSSIITDDTGKVTTRVVYLPFGEISQANSGGANVVTNKFTGQQFDQEFGLHYYGARYYDPSIGRFVSADTVIPASIDAQAWNRYSYVRNAPSVLTDPTGHSWLSNLGKWFARNWQVFAAAAIIAATICFAPYAAPMLIGEVVGGTMGALVAGKNWRNGLLVGVAIGGLSAWAASAIPGSGVWAGMGRGATIGLGQGLVAGYRGGQGSLDEILLGGLEGMVVGAAVGGLMGYLENNQAIPELKGVEERPQSIDPAPEAGTLKPIPTKPPPQPNSTPIDLSTDAGKKKALAMAGKMIAKQLPQRAADIVNPTIRSANSLLSQMASNSIFVTGIEATSSATMSGLLRTEVLSYDQLLDWLDEIGVVPIVDKKW